MKHFKKIESKFLFSLLIMSVWSIIAVGQTTAKISKHIPEIEKWIQKQFAKGKTPPFSFICDGKPSAEFIRQWDYSQQKIESEEADVIKYLFTYYNPTNGLKVECTVKGYPSYQAAEWVLNFTNKGTSNSPTLEQVKVVDLAMQYASKGEFKLHYADGNHISKYDFHPRSVTLATGETKQMSPQGGRSSEGDYLPFFNIESPAGQGVILGVGWSGTWYADVCAQDNRTISMASGMKTMKLYLRPQETIRTPSISLMFWENIDRMAGHNKFRRFVLAHKSRKINGKFAEYPLSSGFNYRDPAPCTEYSCLTADYAIAMVKRYIQFGLKPEVFWLDAGWYNHSADVANHKNWANTVGNWTVDSIRFPEGLRPIADEVHRVGSKFMVWFEPERVMKGSAWALQHPQWMLDARGKAKQEDWTKDGEHDSYLFNLGNPEACRWMSKYIGDFLEENGIDYYRQDFNIEPEGFWAANDEPGRQGICEIRYIEGLYSFWEYLLNRFPGLLVDNCASGGRRIDLESISRSAPMWRTDYSYGEPIGYQCHTYGLNLYLPLHGTGTVSADKFTFRSSLGTSIIYNWKITEAGQSIYDMRDRQAEFKELRPYFYEDYYPLSGINNITSENIWLAYQL